MFGIKINKNYRLIIEPITESLDIESLKKGQKANLKGFADYHDGKCEWIIPWIISSSWWITKRAIRTNYSPKNISEVIRGKKDISSEFANCLEYATGVPAHFWSICKQIMIKKYLK